MVVRYVLTFGRRRLRSDPTPEVERCVVHFTLDQIRSAVRVVGEGHDWKAPRGDGGPVVNTWKRHHPDRFLEWLEAKAAGADVVEVPEGEWRCWFDVVYAMLAQRSFASISCELCGRDYAADDIREYAYEEHHGPRDAIGGWRFLCPGGHHLYFITSWIS
jgi:hypothetical protein